MNEWREWASCIDKDPEIWFPMTAKGAEAAITICQMCPVRVPCLQAGKAIPGAFGVWGGVWLG